MNKLNRPAVLPAVVARQFEEYRGKFRRMEFSHGGRKYGLLYHTERLRNPSTRYGVDSAAAKRPILCLIESEGKPAAYLVFNQYRFATPDPDYHAESFLLEAADAHSQALYEISTALSRVCNIEEIVWHGDILECAIAYTLPGQPADGFWISGMRALLTRMSGLSTATLAFEVFPIEYAGLEDRHDFAGLVQAFEHRLTAMRRLHARAHARYCDLPPYTWGTWTFIPLDTCKKHVSRRLDPLAA